MLIPEAYLNIKKMRGRSLHEIGVAEVAFTRPDVLDALKSLDGSQAGVLGGDVLKVVGGKPKYTYDNWYVKKAPQEDTTDFLRRSITEAEKYVKAYPDPEDGTILYTLVVSELGMAGRT